MRAMDVMTTEVVTAAPDTPVTAIAELLLDHGISAVPVVDAARRVVGLVSEGDLMRRVDGDGTEAGAWWLRLFSSPGGEARDYVKAHGRHARDVMTTDVVTVTGDALIGEVARLLEGRRIKRVPVVRDGELIGIVSRANLIHGLAAAVDESAAPPSTDSRDLRERAMRAIAEVPGVNPAMINVIVRDDAVEIWGVIDALEQEQAVRVAVENLEGAERIETHLGRVPNWAWGI